MSLVCYCDPNAEEISFPRVIGIVVETGDKRFSYISGANWELWMATRMATIKKFGGGQAPGEVLVLLGRLLFH